MLNLSGSTATYAKKLYIYIVIIKQLETENINGDRFKTEQLLKWKILSKSGNN